ncbi:MAG: hypothetical protein EXR12_17435 [Rhodospirillaceae bacterium]|nr:hypothetical protein [Rhodospirillaceae bacterium]
MNMQPQARAIARRRSKSALNWVDFLVIAATVLTFAVVVIANNPHSKKSSHTWLLKDASLQTGHVHEDIDVVRVRLRVATGA